MIRPIALLLVALFCGSCASIRDTKPATRADAIPDPATDAGLFAEITTPRGTILCELFFKTMPLTVASFVGLAEGTLGPEPRKPFFDGLTFHRVVPGFVIQGGDPTGTGRGGPGYRFPDEFAAGLRHDGPGLLSMANSGPDTNGSQFFVTLGEARYLDYVHAIFGRVIRGADIPAKIQTGDTMHVKILRRGRAAQAFRADEQAFNALLARASRAKPPHFVDRSGNGAAGEHWQARYIENRLANLARFTGRHLYVRLFSALEPEKPGQPAADFAQELLAQLHAPAGAMLACYFAAEDTWVLVGQPPAVKLPELKPSPPPRAPATTAEAIARQNQNRLYHATGQVISSLIDQTDPK